MSAIVVALASLWPVLAVIAVLVVLAFLLGVERYSELDRHISEALDVANDRDGGAR